MIFVMKRNDLFNWGYLAYSFEIIMVPTLTGKIGVHFPVKEKSGNFEHTGKVVEFYQTSGTVMEF